MLKLEANILIVDDMNMARMVTQNVLTRLGFKNFHNATNGKQAIEVLNKTKIDLIVSDWNMPEMNGLDFFRAIRSDSKFKSIPFIMVTAETENDQTELLKREGVLHYVPKPVDPELISKIVKAIS